jgi:hypothetical protein
MIFLLDTNAFSDLMRKNFKLDAGITSASLKWQEQNRPLPFFCGRCFTEEHQVVDGAAQGIVLTH